MIGGGWALLALLSLVAPAPEGDSGVEAANRVPADAIALGEVPDLILARTGRLSHATTAPPHLLSS